MESNVTPDHTMRVRVSSVPYPIGVSDNTIGFEPIEKGSIPLWGAALLVYRIAYDPAKVERQVRFLYGACRCGVMETQHAVNVLNRVRIPTSALCVRGVMAT